MCSSDLVDKIRDQVQSAKRAKGEEPRELSETEAHEIKTYGEQE